MNQATKLFPCFLSLFLIVALVFISSPALAQSGGLGSKIGNKLGRGIVNLGLGFIIDVPKTIYYESSENGVLYGSTAGLGLGIVNGVVRTGVGAYETVTFPIPFPQDYQEIVRPGYVFKSGKTRYASNFSTQGVDVMVRHPDQNGLPPLRVTEQRIKPYDFYLGKNEVTLALHPKK